MRILTFSNSPLDEAQGSGYVILNYARGLQAQGHTVDLLGPAAFGVGRRGGRGIRYRVMLGMVRQAFQKRCAYDVFEFYGGEAWLAMVLLRCLRNRPLLVAHSNGLEPLAHRLLRQADREQGVRRRRWYQPDLSILYQWAFRAADGLVTVSEFDRDFALSAGYLPEHRVMAIDNPLPESYLGLPLVHERSPKIVFCGSWIPRKGVSNLSRDVGAFLASHPAYRLLLVGMGQGFKVAEHFPSAVVDQVEVIGPVDRTTELVGIYQQCRVAIQTSVYESFGLAVAEAMACGCAVIATRVGFAAALKPGEEAILTAPSNSEGLQSALVCLAGDENLRRRLAAAGYLRVQSLRWRPALDRLESQYTTWLTLHAGDRVERFAG